MDIDGLYNNGNGSGRWWGEEGMKGVEGEGGGLGAASEVKNMLSTFHTGPIFQNIYGSASNISTGVHKHTHTRCAPRGHETKRPRDNS